MSVKKNTSWMRVFKIKRITDGLFKDKGMNKYFSERGNVWATKALAKAHIKMNDYHPDTYKNCVIVEYQLEEMGVHYV